MNWETRVTKLLGIKYPIIQGGLAYLAYSDLAAAVSNAGGLGQVTAMSLASPDLLKEEIRKVKALTDKPFGINFAIGQQGRPFEGYVEAALEEGMEIATITGGTPKLVFDLLEGTNVKKLVLVAAKRQAVKAEELGAEGVEMGTRFIATKECIHASEAYKQALINGTEQDTVVIKRSLGAPGRAIANSWTEQILQLEQEDVGYNGLRDYISGASNKKFIYDGKKDEGFGWAGQVLGLIKDDPTVEQLFTNIITTAEGIRKKWQQ